MEGVQLLCEMHHDGSRPWSLDAWSDGLPTTQTYVTYVDPFCKLICDFCLPRLPGYEDVCTALPDGLSGDLRQGVFMHLLF